MGAAATPATVPSGGFRRLRALQRYANVYFAVRRRYLLLRYPRLTLEPGVRIGGRLRISGPVRVRIGAGSRLTKSVRITGYGEVTIGRNTLLNGPWIGCWQSVTIGNDCLVSESDIVDTDYHNLQPHLRHAPPGPKVSAPIVIEDNVWIGARTAVLKGVTVGSGSVLGLGTIVRRSVPPRVVVIGDPQHIVQQFD